MFGRKSAPPSFVRACTVFVSAPRGTALVAALFNHGGLFAEQPDGIAECSAGDAASLGAAVRAALDACRYEPEFNYRDRKRTDWPAFRHSGCRSVREFEREYAPIGVRSVNEANLICAVESPPFGKFELQLAAHVSYHAPAVELGECVGYVWQEYRRAAAG